MADEENPLGGGPFGVGPFGPLVGAAAAATAFVLAATNTTAPLQRTLYYQANIAPVPLAIEPIQAETFPVTTAGVRSKSLFYQARIGPPPRAEVVVVDVTPAQWLVPFSRAVPRAPVKVTLTTPFVPALTPPVTAGQWLQPFKRQVAVPLPVHTQPTFPYQPIVVVADVTAGQWLPAWRGPPSYRSAPAGGSPFVPKEAVLENTQTPDKWLPRWQGPPSYHPAPAGGSPFVPKEAVRENTVTPDAWMPRWQGPPRYLQALAAGTVYPWQAAAAVNTRTEWDWSIAWQGPPRRLLGLPGGLPFVPKEATLENTQTPDKWLKPLGTVPPRYVPPKILAQPFVPKEAVLENTVTPDKWLIKWQGPPRYLLPLPSGSPFVAKEAVLENTVTVEKWLVRFAKAVPAPLARPTQPVLGYPYTSQAIVVPYEQWWHQPLSRAAALTKRPVHNRQFQPFVPAIEVIQNTVTPDKWHRDLSRPVAKRPVTHTQPGWSYEPPAVAQDFVAASVSSSAVFRKTLHYQAWATFGYPYEQARIEPPWAVEVTTNFVFKRTLYYQAKIFGSYAPPVGQDAIEGGPADEPERVICVLEHSRVATVPEALRTATVLVDLRVATVPEESRTVEVLFSERDEDSNQFTTLPCPGIIVIPEPEGDAAFQEDAFQDDGFQ